MIGEEVIVFGAVGAIGGLLRALVGVRKAYLQNRKFVPGYFFITIISASIIGAVLGSIIGINNIVALAAGYAGSDLLEGLAKSVRALPIKIG